MLYNSLVYFGYGTSASLDGITYFYRHEKWPDESYNTYLLDNRCSMHRCFVIDLVFILKYFNWFYIDIFEYYIQVTREWVNVHSCILKC
jgi:hypothetical protein